MSSSTEHRPPLTMSYRLLIVLCMLFSSCQAQAQSELEVAFPNLSFSRPVDIQHAGDGSNRLFVLEQAGVIQVFENDRDVQSSEVFLDIRDRVDDQGNEEGLLGLAFHPDFSSNGYFYVDYTAANPDRTVVARYEVDPDDPDRADPDSGLVILEVDQPFSNHNAGQIVFGPDGYFYVTLGDGGAGGDPMEHGQNRSTLLGSILRIDVDNPQDDRNYGIPEDNPLVGADCGPAGCREEIYAYGLRNPWRISFDPATDQLWAADVGQNAYEEIDLIEAGNNYGWNVMEGMHCYEPSTGCDQSGLTLPVWEYPHSQGQSVTGGYVYRGDRVPGLVGAYVYADFVSGRIWALRLDGDEVDNVELANTSLGISTFGVDAEGELYLASFGGFGSEGRIYRFASDVGTGTAETVPTKAHHFGESYPNPFRTAVTIPYVLGASAHVSLDVYDVTGRRVRTLRTERHEAGNHTVRWRGLDDAGMRLPGGVYVFRLSVGNTVADTERVVYVR